MKFVALFVLLFCVNSSKFVCLLSLELHKISQSLSTETVNFRRKGDGRSRRIDGICVRRRMR